MKLAELFTDVEEPRIAGDASTEVLSLSYRSDQVEPGCLFFCVPGFVRDGHDFAAQAVDRGAVALCVERLLPLAVPQVLVPSTRRAMGPAASRFFRNPSARLLTAGVTGTNGKTTSAFLTAHLLEEAGLRTGLLGTVERRIGGVSRPADRTTPEALDLQSDFASMIENGDQAAVMEVSSHALELGRVDGVTFRSVAFTNLTQDHLDFHGDLESYFRSKELLFVDPRFADGQSLAVVNVGDPYGRRLAAKLAGRPLMTYLVATGNEEGLQADLTLRNSRLTRAGSSGELVVQGEALRQARRGRTAEEPPASSRSAEEQLVLPLHTPLIGLFNLANVLTAVGLGLGLGLGLEPMLSALTSFTGVPGRMERVDGGLDFSVLVDYAHTPDSIDNVLRTAREVVDGRVIAVMGCGGNRDKGKRPRMGGVAEAGSDILVVTSDNPRKEDPNVIIAEILAGLERPQRAIVQEDRRAAIRTAVGLAEPGDMVLILGKGHESGQELADRTIPFDDRAVAREELARRDVTR